MRIEHPKVRPSRATKVHLLKDNVNTWCQHINVESVNTTRDERLATCVQCLRTHERRQPPKHRSIT